MNLSDILSLRKGGLTLVPQIKFEKEGKLCFRPGVKWSIPKQVRDVQPDVNPKKWEKATGCAVLLGENSDGAAAFDLDAHENEDNKAIMPKIRETHARCVEAVLKRFPSLYVGSTRSVGGYHIMWKHRQFKTIGRKGKEVLGSIEEHNCVDLLNTWLIYGPPTERYSDINGTMADLPYLEAEEFEELKKIVTSFYNPPTKKSHNKDTVIIKTKEIVDGKVTEVEEEIVRPEWVEIEPQEEKSGTVFYNFRKRGGLFNLLEEKGWSYAGVGSSAEIQLWLRPGGTKECSAAVIDGACYCFSDSTDIPTIANERKGRGTRTCIKGYSSADTATILLFGKEALDENLSVKREYLSRCVKELELRGYQQDIDFDVPIVKSEQPIVPIQTTETKPPTPPINDTIPPFSLWPENSWLPQLRDDIAQNVQVDPLAVDATMLGALSVFTARFAEVFWINKEATNTYILVAMAASERKSSIFRYLFTPIGNMDSESLLEYKKAKNYWENTKKKFDIQLKKAIGGRSPDPNRADQILKEAACHQTQQPIRIKRWIPSDFNLEALYELFKSNRALSLASPEANVIDHLTTKNRERDRKFQKMLLSGWNGDAMGQLRVDVELERNVMDKCFSILLMTQPNILERLAEIKDKDDSGLNSRFISVFPKSKVGFRTSKVSPVNQELLNRWELCLKDLDKRKQTRLTFEPKSLSILQELNDIIEKKLPEFSQASQYYFGKLMGNICRLAGILHLVSSPTEDNIIKLEILKKAVYFIASAEGANEEITRHTEIKHYDNLKKLFQKYPKGGFNTQADTYKNMHMRVSALKNTVKIGLEENILFCKDNQYFWLANPSESIDCSRSSVNVIMQAFNEALQRLVKNESGANQSDCAMV